MKYTVTHSPRNPRNRETANVATLADAKQEMRKMTADGPNAGTSYCHKGGTVIASRDWDKSRITWLK